MRYLLYLLAFLVYIFAATWGSWQYALLAQANALKDGVRPLDADYIFGAAFGVTLCVFLVVAGLFAWVCLIIAKKKHPHRRD